MGEYGGIREKQSNLLDLRMYLEERNSPYFKQASKFTADTYVHDDHKARDTYFRGNLHRGKKAVTSL